MKKHKPNRSASVPDGSESDGYLDDYEEIPGDESDSSILNNLNVDSDESSSEEEVLPIHSASDSDSNDEDVEDENSDDVDDDDMDVEDGNISDSDIDNDEDDLPSSKAWGKKKNLFYNADLINDKSGFLNEEEEEAAKMEEEEARIIQKRLMSEIDSADLSCDLLTDAFIEEEPKDKERIEIDLSQMGEHEKLKLIKKECPELLTYISEFKRLMKCVKIELLPVIQFYQSNKKNYSEERGFIETFHQIIMNYCTNIAFFVLLKSRRADTKNHPITKWLLYYQNILKELEPMYVSNVKSTVEKILNGDLTADEITTSRKKKRQTEIVKTKNIKLRPNKIQMEENEINTNSVQELKLNGNSESEEKRPISYQIAKNKGLTPRRKKELRNPRVKHRLKYRKAKIRRKGQVREVRKELQKYGGEISGIKAGVIKSVKFKH